MGLGLLFIVCYLYSFKKLQSEWIILVLFEKKNVDSPKITLSWEFNLINLEIFFRFLFVSFLQTNEDRRPSHCYPYQQIQVQGQDLRLPCSSLQVPCPR